jgi:hypothetical protein
MMFNRLSSAMDAADPVEAYRKALRRVDEAEKELAIAKANLKYWDEKVIEFRNQNKW